jgi:endonuclease YncB( thermonuclease family)
VSTPNRGGRGTDTSGSDRLTKSERKEQARIEREQIQRQMDRKRRTRALVFGAILALSAIALAAIVVTSSGEDTPPAASGELPGMMTSTAPWGSNTEDLGGRLEILSLPELSEEAGALHNHTRVEIWVNGEQVEVPANVGFDEARRHFSPLHTHEVGGIFHTESADPNFSTDLGTVFDVWGLRLTSDCVGAYCAEGDKQVRVFVDGEPVTGDPRDVPIDDLSVIVVTYGNESQLPDPIPADFVPTA